MNLKIGNILSGLIFTTLATSSGGCGGGLRAGSPLPDLSIQLMDTAKRFDTRNIQPGQAIAILYFSPSCNYCRQEMKELIEHIGQLQKVCFLLVTDESYEDLAYFYREYNLSRISNFIVGRDDQLDFYHYLKPRQIPFLAIYSKEKQLQKVCVGAEPVEQIIKLAQHALRS